MVTKMALRHQESFLRHSYASFLYVCHTNCFDEDEAIGRRRGVVARWSSSWHRRRCLFALLLSSSSPCCQPLFLLDCWILAVVMVSLCCCCRRRVVVARWSLSWHRCHCLFALLLSSSSPCCQQFFCWIVGFWPLSLSLCVAVVVVARWSSSWHRCHLCIAVGIVIPLLSTIVFVGLLDVGRHNCLFVLLLSLSQDGHRHGIVVVVSLCCCCRNCPLVVNHCLCWIVGFWPLSSSLCVAVVTPLFLLLLLLLSVLGHHHCRSGLAHFQLIFLYLYFAFYLFLVLIEFEIADREIIEKL